MVPVQLLLLTQNQQPDKTNYSRVRVIYVRVIYDGTGNFQTFWRKPIVTQIRVIYNFPGTGNFVPDIFEKLFIPSDLS